MHDIMIYLKMLWISSFMAMKIILALFLRTFLGCKFPINLFRINLELEKFRIIESTAKTILDVNRKIEAVGTANNNGAATLITVDRKKCFEGNMFRVSIIHISFSLFNVKKIRWIDATYKPKIRITKLEINSYSL